MSDKKKALSDLFDGIDKIFESDANGVSLITDSLEILFENKTENNGKSMSSPRLQ